MSTAEIRKLREEILSHVPKDYGMTTARIGKSLAKPFGHNQSTYSGWLLQQLLALESEGKIRRLDQLKPIVWTRP